MSDSLFGPGLYTVATEPLSMKQIFFTNLQLLGFDKSGMEAKHTIPFNKDMFNLPNKRGAEVILHFLFNRFNPVMCKEEFRDCWPITDKKTEQMFRKTCRDWLSNISKEDSDSHFPRIVASMFMSPGGEKFYQLLFSFSRFVLQQCIKTENDAKNRDCLGYPVLTAQNKKLAECMYSIEQCDLVRNRKNYMERVQELLLLHEEWKEYASESVKEHRRLTKIIRDLERDVREEKREAADFCVARGSPMPPRRSGGFSSETSPVNIKRTQKVQKTRDMWKKLEEFYSTETAERDVIDSILQCTVNKHRIDASNIDVKVPDMLLRKCAKEIQKRQIDNTYQGGKVNLLSLVKLWNLSLHLYLERIHEVGVPDYRDDLAQVSTQVHTHHAHVANAQSLRVKMSDMIPDIQACIKSLKTETQISPKPTSPERIKTSVLGFSLVPPTPPLSFTPDDKNTNYTPRGTLKVSPDQVAVDTPEAAVKIMHTVATKARKGSDRLFPDDRVHPGFQDKKGTVPDVKRASHSTTKIPQHYNPHRPTVERKTEQKAIVYPHVKKKTPTVSQSKHIQIEKDKSATLPNVKVVRENVSPRTPFSHNNIQSTPTGTLTKQNPAIKRIVRGQMPSQQPLTRSPAKMVTPKAFDILADKIVDAVAGNGTPVISDMIEFSMSSPDKSPMDINLKDPLAGLDQDAFTTREKLQHSPLKMEVRKMWRDAVNEDEVYSSPVLRTPLQKNDTLNSSQSSTTAENITSYSASSRDSQSLSSSKTTPRQDITPKQTVSEEISPSEKMAQQIMFDIPCSPADDFGLQFSAEFPIMSLPVNRRRLTMEDCGLDIREAKLFDFEEFPASIESPYKETYQTEAVSKIVGDSDVIPNRETIINKSEPEAHHVSNKNNSSVEVPQFYDENTAILSSKGKRARSEEEEYSLSLQRQSKMKNTSAAEGFSDHERFDEHTVHRPEVQTDKLNSELITEDFYVPSVNNSERNILTENVYSSSSFNNAEYRSGHDKTNQNNIMMADHVQINDTKYSSHSVQNDVYSDSLRKKDFSNVNDGGYSSTPSKQYSSSFLKSSFSTTPDMQNVLLQPESIPRRVSSSFNNLQTKFDGEGLDDIEIPHDALHMSIDDLFKTQTPTLTKKLMKNTSVDSDISFNHFSVDNSYDETRHNILATVESTGVRGTSDASHVPCISLDSFISVHNSTCQSDKSHTDSLLGEHSSKLYSDHKNVSDINLRKFNKSGRTESHRSVESFQEEDSLNDSFAPFSLGIQVTGSSPSRLTSHLISSGLIENEDDDIISRFHKLKQFTSQVTKYDVGNDRVNSTENQKNVLDEIENSFRHGENFIGLSGNEISAEDSSVLIPDSPGL